MEYFHIYVFFDNGDYEVMCQDGATTSSFEKDAGKWPEKEARRLHRHWLESEKRKAVSYDMKFVVAHPECGYCTQIGCPHCGHLSFYA